MAAYVIGNIRVTNPEQYPEYTSQVQATLEPYNGRFVVRGGDIRILEGDWHERVVVIEFPSFEAAGAWYDSVEYQRIAPIRQAHSTGRLVIVQGQG